MRRKYGWLAFSTGLAVSLLFLLEGRTGRGATLSAARSASTKVVILGFDGADARTVERLLREGRLPHLAELARRGTYRPLLPTNPPQTPVSWSSMATGLTPGRTGIFDFLKRDRKTYYPAFALNEEAHRRFLFGQANGPVIGSLVGLSVAGLAWVGLRRRTGRRVLVVVLSVGLGVVGGVGAGGLAYRYLPYQVPQAVNHRQGTPFWTLVDRQGLRAYVIRYPTTFPAEKLRHGFMLSGLGVPDIRGTIGQPTIYTDDASLLAQANEFSLKVEVVDVVNTGGRIRTVVWGPRNKLYCDTRRADCRAFLEKHGRPVQFQEPLEIYVDSAARTVTVRYRDQTATLRPKEWSDWFVFTFPVHPLLRLRAIGRFYLIRLEPFLLLYLSPLHFHPESHPIPFTWPPDGSDWLLRQVGLFKTMGWDIDTWTITSGVVDEDHFLEDTAWTVEKQRQIFRTLFTRGDWDVYVQVFDFTDRVQHILWRLIDPRHPLYDPTRAEKYAREIERAYEEMDAIVGEAMERLPPGSRLLVVSDHGFTSFRRGMNYNTWLVQHGFMKLKGVQVTELETLEDLFLEGDFFEHVDWSQTKAYALGLGPIYINLKGREAHGSVEPGEEYETVRRAIIRGLESYVDPVTGERPVYKVYTREEMYPSGFDPDLIPDLRVAHTYNYRVSWQTTLGHVAPDVVEDNLRNWSADHCSAEPSIVPGILFTNWPIRTEQPRIIDIMPTVLRLLGLPIPPGLDGHPLEDESDGVTK